jgi:glycosyltransferase involved in cell wall biosynthesis
MHIIYFLTYNYSFKSWNESGNLPRELAYFKKFKEFDENIKFTFVSYGKKDDRKFFDRSLGNELISIYEYLPYCKNKYLRFLVSLYAPFVLKKMIDIKSVDLVKQNQIQGSWVSIIFKIIVKKPIIIRTGYDALTFKIKERKPRIIILFYKLLTKYSLSQSDIYTVTSEVDKKFLKSNFKNYKKIKLRRNFVTVNNNYVKIPVENRDSKIICVGRLVEQKNLFFIIDEFKDLQINLEIYGDGSQKEKLTSLISLNSLPVNVMGQIENPKILDKLNNSKYFVSASFFEGNPKNVLEAMLSGCIVFVSENENTKEIITDGEDGFLYSLEKGALKRKFSINTLNEELLHNISLNASNRVKKNNSLEKLVKLEISDFKEVVPE